MQLVNNNLPLIKKLDKERELKIIGYTESNLTLYITKIGYVAAIYNSKPARGKGLGVGQTKELLILKDYIKFSRTGATLETEGVSKYIIKKYSFYEYNKDNFDLDKAVEKVVMKELENKGVCKNG